MLESFLLVFLGVLGAGLVSLLLAPVLWRHAVQLTTRRIHGSTPLSLADIQADKDQLRAQFAVTARKLEVAAETWQDKAAGLQVNLAKAEAAAEAAEREAIAKNGVVEDLEGQLSMVKDELAQTQDELAGYLKSLKDTSNRLTEERARFEQQAKRLNQANLSADERKVEIVALKTQAANLQDRIAGLEDDISRVTGERDEAREALTQARGQVREITSGMEQLKQKLAAREKSLESLKLETANSEESARVQAREAKARAEQLSAEKAALARQVEELRGRLQSEMAAERAANEDLRQQLADVAAKVVAASMSADERISVAIGTILKNAGPGGGNGASGAGNGGGNGASGNGAPDVGKAASPGRGQAVPAMSLAERIRAEAAPPA